MRDRLLPLRLNEFPRSLQQFFEFTIRQASFDRMRLTCGSHNAVPLLALHALREKLEQRAKPVDASDAPDRLKRRIRQVIENTMNFETSCGLEER